MTKRILKYEKDILKMYRNNTKLGKLSFWVASALIVGILVHEYVLFFALAVLRFCLFLQGYILDTLNKRKELS